MHIIVNCYCVIENPLKVTTCEQKVLWNLLLKSFKQEIENQLINFTVQKNMVQLFTSVFILIVKLSPRLQFVIENFYNLKTPSKPKQ